MKKTGINLKIFKKYLKSQYGKKCPDYNISCIVCQTWRVFEDLKAFIENDEFLERTFE